MVGEQSQARGVSADGSTLVGAYGCQTFVWKPNQSLVLFGDTGCTAVEDVSADGSVVVGTTSVQGVPGQHAYRWTPTDGLRVLGEYGQPPFSHGVAVSDDGRTVLGNKSDGITPYETATWQDAGPWQTSPPGLDWLALSGDGQIRAGVQQITFDPPLALAFRQRGDAVEYLSNLPDAQNADPSDASADGGTIVGMSVISGTPVLGRATLWNQQGQAIDLGILPTDIDSNAYGVSGDGGTVVGISSNWPLSRYRGFVWSASGGMRDLNAIVGVGSNERVWLASATSEDGCIIAGAMLIDGVSRAIAIRSIPVPYVRSAFVAACPSGVTKLNVDPDPNGFGRVRYQWERIDENGIPVPVTDGPLPSSISTLAGTDTGELSITLADVQTVALQYRCRVWNGCGERVSDPITLSLIGDAPMPCDNLDFNNDCSVFDPLDIADFLSVYSEGPCSTGACNDIDFNNDGALFDPCDIDAFLLVFSEGPCTLCGE